jgi:hypothetical protein
MTMFGECFTSNSPVATLPSGSFFLAWHFFFKLAPSQIFHLLTLSFLKLVLSLCYLYYSISGKQCNNAKAVPKHLFSNGGLARVLHMQEAELNFLALTLIYFVGLLQYDALWCSIVLSEGEI